MVTFCIEIFQSVNRNAKILTVFFLQYLFMEVLKRLMRKEYRWEQILAELRWVHRRTKAKCQPLQPSYIKRIEFFLFAM